MFVAAIERAAQFTRPIHSIARFWGSTNIIPGAASLFFVNGDGWALTCRHVMQQLAAADQALAKFNQFKAERAGIPNSSKGRRLLKGLHQKYGYTKGTLLEMYNSFVNCVEGPLEVEGRAHPSLDLALLHFANYTKLLCSNFPVFPQDSTGLKQGKFLCRLGFPFPEFTNFEYDATADKVQWTQTGRTDTPRFPIEGMITRHLQGPQGEIAGFELSTPGLRGQSGGPAFDTEGRVWGMQAATGHLDLDFDVDVEVLRAGEKRRIRDSAFLHVGHCIHPDVLKQFMRDQGVAFQEG